MSKMSPWSEFEAHEFPFDTVRIIQSDGLPRRTIVAPADFVRQCHRELGVIDIQILTGDTSAIQLSPDLYDAYQKLYGSNEP